MQGFYRHNKKKQFIQILSDKGFEKDEIRIDLQIPDKESEIELKRSLERCYLTAESGYKRQNF